MGRHIAGGPAQPDRHQIVPVLPAKIAAKRPPVVGRDVVVAFNILRGARDIDDHRQRLFLPRPPEEDRPDVVVLDPLDRQKVGGVRLAVHHGVTVFIDRAAVVRHHRVPEAVRELALPAAVPSFLHARPQPAAEELDIVLRRHGPFHAGILPFGDPRRGMGMSRREEHLIDIKIGERRFYGVAELHRCPAPDTGGIDRDNDRRVDRLIPLARLDGDHIGRQPVRYPLRLAGLELTGENHRFLRGDVDRFGADINLGAGGRSGTKQDTQHQHSRGKRGIFHRLIPLFTPEVFTSKARRSP